MAKGTWPLSPDVASLRSRSLKLDDLHPRTALTDDTASDDGAATSCCDAHPELCKSMDPQPPTRMEVVAFHAPGMYGATPDSWKLYDFSKITAIGNFYQLDPEMLCLAHSKQVRILDWYLCNGPNGDPNFIPHQLNPYNEPAMLLNSTLIELYVAFSAKCVKSHGLDGMVLDIVSRKIARLRHFESISGDVATGEFAVAGRSEWDNQHHDDGGPVWIDRPGLRAQACAQRRHPGIHPDLHNGH